MPLPDIAWDNLDKKGREAAWMAIRAVYSAQGGFVLSDKEALRRYRADLLGLDWTAAPQAKTSTGNKLRKIAAFATFAPLVIVSPGATMNILDRIDHRLTDDDAPALAPVADSREAVARVEWAQKRALEAAAKAMRDHFRAPPGSRCGRCGEPVSPVWVGKCEHCKAKYGEYPPVRAAD